MRVIDDDITPQHQLKCGINKRVKERERERERERDTNPNQQREREKEVVIFSILRFDSATSSFLALSVIKSFRKNLKSAKSQTKKIPDFAVPEMFKTIFLSLEFCHVTHPKELKILVDQL